VGIEKLLRQMENLSPADEDLIRRAYDVAMAAHEGQARASGEPYIHHCLAVAQMLAELRLDPATVAAGLLHDVAEDSILSIEDLRQEFGNEVAKLVDGVTKLGKIGHLTQRGQKELEAARLESLRKMFLAMVDDVRVVLIKLADRLHNMRTLGALPEEKRRRIAKETLDIFAPLANRLGIWKMKWELEDLAFRHLNPQKYREIAALLEERRADRERYIQQIVEVLRKKLKEEGIEAEVSGRPKHIYSIYRKMQRKGVDFDQIHDVRGVRIIVNEVRDCYAALGVVHSLWPPIPGEFDDFIATPKDNMYRSLHTAVVGPGGKTLEVQIRTWEMHRMAEYGIAAHWRYKEEKTKRDPIFEAKIAWLRQLMEWRQEVTEPSEFLDSLKSDVFQDRVYVFSPKGDIFDLPAGSTPIDFAYYVHTEIGHRCRGAKVNGHIVPLDYQLQNGDQVEILTAKRGGPSRDWLNPNLGYVKTSRARQKIRQWFKRQAREENLAQGREILEKELRRLGLEDRSHEDLAQLFGYEKVDDFLVAIGCGDLNPQQLDTKILEAERQREEERIPETRPPVPRDTGITVTGVGNLPTNLARCCTPLPGDEIIGYITRGRGVTIHRKDCPNILRLSRDRERLIQVEWGRDSRRTYPVVVKIRAWDRGGLLRDVAAVVANEGINMSAVNVITKKKENLAIITATLEITGAAQLARVLTKIERLPNVIEAQRQLG